DDADHVACRITRQFTGAVAREIRAEPGLHQEAVRQRRRPRRLLDALIAVHIAATCTACSGAAGLRRERRRATVDKSRRGLIATALNVRRPRRTTAWLLFVPEDAELIARCRLNRQT